ncbi:MAG TPA: MFS transporter [Saprospiraceae bacterium]|nr:MFS transporter [Saprospiraceae bacterium]
MKTSAALPIALQPSPKNDKRIITGWAFFDWANSAYALVITVAIFPGYFLAMTSDTDPATADYVRVLGLRMTNSTLFAYCISLAYLVIAAISPLLSGIADYGGKRIAFLRFFTLMGALACMSLLFFTGMNTLWVGVAGFIMATIGFAGGIVFYNSFLPLIATEDRYDDVSAKGFSYGFIGSVILLIVNLIVISNYQWFGFEEKILAVPTAFVMVGLWWIGFAQIPLRRLPKDTPPTTHENLLTKGYEEIKKVWQVVKSDSNTKAFLVAFFCYNAGVQAVLFLASTFAERELHFDTQKLIFLVLILQIVAIGGAWASAKLSGRKGNKFSIMVMLCIWTVICIVGYFVKTGLDFYLLASAVGLVMGGIQSLSRATYAKLLPEDTPDTASYFSFYDVMDKVSTVTGTFTFGLVEQLTGGMRNSVAALAVFFVISLIVLATVKIKRMSTNAHLHAI